MTKNEYLEALCGHLNGLSPKERQEILLDFQEHFSVGLAQGKTEDEICRDLGAPEFAAQQYVGEEPVPQAPPAPPAGGYQAPAYGPPVYPRPNPPVAQQDTGEKVIYILLFIAILFFLAIPGYPTAFAFVIAFFALLISGIVAGIAVGSAALAVFLISLGLIFLSVGVLLFVGITAALRVCFRKLN